MPIKGVVNKARVPIKIWSDLHTVESAALDQLTNLANLPFVYKHVAAMPDVHLGKGATVGSVVATRGAICPAAVGVDIGCGMMAIKTDLDPQVVQDSVTSIRSAIEEVIPVGHLGNTKTSKSVNNWYGWDRFSMLTHWDQFAQSKAVSQMGTLGGGNHFIELCLDENNAVWVMLHSGSRNIGKIVAERHMDMAKDLMKKMFIHLPDPDLSYFAEKTKEFTNYLNDVLWCQEYAMANREEMMRKVLYSLSMIVHGEDGKVGKLMEVNCHHNYVDREHHYGEDVLITRKGAVRARVGDYGIIPGSMGTRSYIVQGRGNAESFCSCSHGAGRRMSRGEAKRVFTLSDLVAQTDGVDCRKDEGVLDEIPGAYKDIDVVMANQSDLVEIVATLKQFMCVKG